MNIISINKYYNITDYQLVNDNQYLKKIKNSNPYYNKYMLMRNKYLIIFDYEIDQERVVFNKYLNIDLDKITTNSNTNQLILFFNNNIYDDTFIKYVSKINVPFKLIVRNYCNNDKYFNEILKNTKCIHIYSTSISKKTDNITPIPLGLADKNIFRCGNLKNFLQIFRTDISKENYILFNFNINTNIEKRQVCYDKCTKLGLKFIEKKSMIDYLILLKKNKFIICPEGYGIDCYRIWESLYYKTVPICLNNPCYMYWAQYFPIMIINDWSELNIDNDYLDSYYENINWDDYNEMLDSTYWENLILN